MQERQMINYNIVLSLLLLLLVAILLISNISIIFGQSDESSSAQSSTEQMNEEMQGNRISSLTEWIGVFALGITILSISVGVIHLLLVQEHAKESYLWGIFFLISGIAQIVFGIIILFAKSPKIN